MNRRFELRCTDRDVEAFKAAAGREAVGAWARRVLRAAAEVEGAGGGGLVERGSLLVEAEVAPPHSTSRPRSASPSPSVVADLLVAEHGSTLKALAETPVTPKRSGRQTAGAGAGMCVHRNPLDAYCKECALD